MHSIENSHVIGLENVSSISDELSDAICSLNTGTGYQERKYYEQGVEFSVNAKRPVLINGIPSNLAERPDLIDRSLTYVFDHLGDKVRSDDRFWQNFDKEAPGIFGAILDGLVGAMRVRQHFDGNNDDAAEVLLEGWHPRFVDGVVWGEAFCRAVGFASGQFV